MNTSKTMTMRNIFASIRIYSKQILDEERAKDTEIPTRRVVPTIKIMAKELENLMNVTNDIQNIISKQKIEEGEKNEKDALRVNNKTTYL